MSYLQFHELFVLPPLLLLATVARRPLGSVGRWVWLGPPLLALVALVYTTPWDNYLVAQGVWGYGEDRVIGTVGYVPLEEYAFFVLQPLLAGLWLYALLRREGVALLRERRPSVRLRGALLYAAVGLAGLPLLSWEPGFYLGLILVWAGPVLAGQWAYGGEVIWNARRVWVLGVIVPTVYLWAADRLALARGIWGVSPEYTTGLRLLGLPAEEAVFFTVTNLMVVQGLLLFVWLGERLRNRGVRRIRAEKTGSYPALRTPPRAPAGRGLSARARRGAHRTRFGDDGELLP